MQQKKLHKSNRTHLTQQEKRIMEAITKAGTTTPEKKQKKKKVVKMKAVKKSQLTVKELQNQASGFPG